MRHALSVAMTVRPPRPGPADYLAMAVGPVLIMIMVGSFAFFLLDVFYRGEHLLRVRWTLFWFVLACVLVSRIGIEFDLGRASLYGLALGGATSLMLMRYVDFLPAVLVLLAVLWWLANRLTWNCTVIDDDTEEPEGGVLAGAGMGPQQVGAREPSSDRDASAHAASGVPRTAPEPQRTPPHAPGLWIVYTALLTLPVFALGEAVLPRADRAARAEAFGWVRLHVAAAVGLLLVTSFLSLRRHLRRRFLDMPPVALVRWSVCGGVLAVVLLAAAALLPRPSIHLHAPGVAGSLKAPAPAASETRQRTSEDPRAGRTSTVESDRGTASAPARSGSEPNRKSRTAQDPGQAQAASRGDASTPPAAAPTSLPPGWGALRAALQTLLVLGFLWLGMRFRSELWRGLMELLESLRRLLGGSVRPEGALPRSAPDRARRAPHRPTNPFATGAADGWGVERVVQETFNRFRAWKLGSASVGNEDERGRSRMGTEHTGERAETPWEFAERLAAEEPELAADLLPVARAYVGFAYGGRQPEDRIRDHCVALWSRMQ